MQAASVAKFRKILQELEELDQDVQRELQQALTPRKAKQAALELGGIAAAKAALETIA